MYEIGKVTRIVIKSPEKRSGANPIDRPIEIAYITIILNSKDLILGFFKMKNQKIKIDMKAPIAIYKKFITLNAIDITPFFY